MLDLTLPGFFVACGSVLLATFLLTEIYDWVNIFGTPEARVPKVIYRTSDDWEHFFNGNRIEYGERSVDIETCIAIVVEPSEPLKWDGYSTEPVAMTMKNDGNTVVVFGIWRHDYRPSIQGGPLSEIYDFHSLVFHWGPTDDTGSKHSLDGVNYPLELQIVHTKRNLHSALEPNVVNEDYRVAIVSILFQIANVDNKCLDHIVKNLWCVSKPGTKICLPLFSLDAIFPLFEKSYYSYCGSMLEETSNGLATCIVQPQSINVSSSQMAEFRKVITDTRRFRHKNQRDLYYHD